MPSADETPGKGIYRCQVCGEDLTIESDEEKLPYCPNCQYQHYYKIK
jgi:DNA-directed RNA polymerase subunit RPC12/RpoP